VAGGAAYVYSPLYRGLTIQFKTYVHDAHPVMSNNHSYIQMSAMVFGGMLEADSRLMAYQLRMRNEKRLARDMEVWRRYEAEYEDSGTPGVGAESNVKRE
jgi:hypothetical protein